MPLRKLQQWGIFARSLIFECPPSGHISKNHLQPILPLELSDGKAQDRLRLATEILVDGQVSDQSMTAIRHFLRETGKDDAATTLRAVATLPEVQML